MDFKYTTYKGENHIEVVGQGLHFHVNTSVKLYVLKEVRKALAEIKEIKRELKNDKNPS